MPVARRGSGTPSCRPRVARRFNFTPDEQGVLGTVASAAATATEPPVAPTFAVVLGWFEERRAKVATLWQTSK